jgi:ribosomal protein S18 acetylase RimI-like enzyme
MLLRTYVQRLRMEAPLRRLPDVPRLPRGFELVPWDPELLDAHAEVKWLSFHDTVDACIFPNLSRLDGCVQLMRTIADHSGFVAGAAWLAHGPEGFCGCIQGVRGKHRKGMIQNLGVLPDCRGIGIGRALLIASLLGFRAAGVSTAQLEVCARNTHAVRLYYELGFQIRKTLYRETREEYSEYAI